MAAGNPAADQTAAGRTPAADGKVLNPLDYQSPRQPRFPRREIIKLVIFTLGMFLLAAALVIGGLWLGEKL